MFYNMYKEIGIGAGVALFIFLLIRGYNVTPVVFLGVAGYVVFYLFRQSRGALSSGIGPITPAPSKKKQVTFEKIGGQNTAKNELLEALDFFKKMDVIEKLGIRPLKGILLSGPPGTGKTLLARAAANYTDSVFFSASGSEFIEMYAGVGAKRIRKLFSSAREAAKKANKNNAIIFIDEIDILGGKRGQHSSHLEYDQTLNQLLVEMDGIEIDDQVKILLIGATNRIEALDRALLRPGRFDRIIRVDLPDREGREKILEIHTTNKPLSTDVDLGEIARETFGFSGAHLENVANEAAIMAMRESRQEIVTSDFREAIEKVMMGEKLERSPKKEEMYRIAVHETGHAVVSELLHPSSVSSLNLTSRGEALGYVRHIPEDDRYLQTREYLEDQISVLVAGSCAEEEILGMRSTGAENDFKKAVKWAKRMIDSGMSSLGVVSPENLPENLLHKTINTIIKKQEEKIVQMIREKQDTICSIVDFLMKEESVDGKTLRGLLKEEENKKRTRALGT